MNKIIYSADFLESVNKETGSILEDINTINLLWDQLDSNFEKVSSQEKNDLHAKFYFFIKFILETCKANVAIFGYVLQELRIAKADRNVDKSIVFEINHEAKRLSGSFKGIKTKQDDLLNAIDICRQMWDYHEFAHNKTFIARMFENSIRKGAKLTESFLHVYLSIQRVKEVAKISNKNYIKPVKKTSKSTGAVEFRDSASIVIDKVEMTKDIGKSVEEVTRLKKQSMIDNLAIQIQELSSKLIYFNDLIDNAASHLVTCVNEIESNKDALIARMGKDGSNIFKKFVETQAIKMAEITNVLQNSFECIAKEISKKIVPTHFIN